MGDAGPTKPLAPVKVPEIKKSVVAEDVSAAAKMSQPVKTDSIQPEPTKGKVDESESHNSNCYGFGIIILMICGALVAIASVLFRHSLFCPSSKRQANCDQECLA